MDDQQSKDYAKSIVEALLFVNEKPVTLQQIKEACEGFELNDLRQAITDLKDEYEKAQRGMILMEIAGGYQMLSNSNYANYIRNFYKTKHKEKLSKPALETLAIIAYKQPVTRSDVEIIRGVNSDGVMVHLLNKELIKAVGRKDVPGRPFLYGTTRQFLEYFGLKSLVDLPKLEDFPSLQKAENEVGPTSQQGAEAAQPQEGPAAPAPQPVEEIQEGAPASSRLDAMEKEMSEQNVLLQEQAAEPEKNLNELSSSSLEENSDKG